MGVECGGSNVQMAINPDDGACKACFDDHVGQMYMCAVGGGNVLAQNAGLEA